MNKISFAIPALLTLFIISSCDDYETYAEKKEKERKAVANYISEHNIKVISESEFNEDTVTDVSKNEFVLFSGTGVYMQIVRRGCGEKLKNGETATVLCRFTEYNILGDSMQLRNDVPYYAMVPDEMTITMGNGTVTSASFIAGSSVMYSAYGTTAVPNGWLYPFRYINVGRQDSEDKEIAKVGLIVPAAQGTSSASSSVYPCFYEITFEKGR